MPGDFTPRSDCSRIVPESVTADGTVPAFLVGTVTIDDTERFGAYIAAIKGLSAEFGGEPVVGGAVSAVLEGDGKPGERVVVTRFPSEADARAYLQSPRYRAAKALREGAGVVTLRLLVT